MAHLSGGLWQIRESKNNHHGGVLRLRLLKHADRTLTLGYDMATAPHTFSSLPDIAQKVTDWVNEVSRLCEPARVHWCEGSDVEFKTLRGELTARGQLKELNPATFPGCFLYRSDPSDVARVEHLTFICTRSQADAGPNNNWMDPVQARARVKSLFAGCMRGRTLYVVPYRISPRSSRSRASAQATAATRCSARKAMRGA